MRKQFIILTILIISFLIGRFAHILGYRYIVLLIFGNLVWITVGLLKNKDIS
ncbi:hypothetical protein DEU39_1162 [Chryseobacterium sp. AG363]|nr:hypothetical protein DEU39_1162 [Chryseobacterium sp. AG363]